MLETMHVADIEVYVRLACCEPAFPFCQICTFNALIMTHVRYEVNSSKQKLEANILVTLIPIEIGILVQIQRERTITGT